MRLPLQKPLETVVIICNNFHFQIILGVVDEFGNLFIFRIEQTDDEDSDNDKPLLTEMLLQVMASQKDSNLDEHRLLW
jgi:hypothetical protein